MPTPRPLSRPGATRRSAPRIKGLPKITEAHHEMLVMLARRRKCTLVEALEHAIDTA